MATQTLQDRPGAISFRGNSMTLLGPELRVGDAAPELHLTASDLSVKTLDDLTDHGKSAALLIVVPSLDTSVCSTESKTFNSRLAELSDRVKAHVVSMDLPFAQSRWCGAEGDISLGMLSDYRDHSFGREYGLLIKELGLLTRANIVIGADRRIRYIEVVKEVTNEPNYDATIAAAKAASA